MMVMLLFLVFEIWGFIENILFIISGRNLLVVYVGGFENVSN